ncbi:MAG: hypothetical protein AAGF07_00175 [Patescibacteria group bacterium]
MFSLFSKSKEDKDDLPEAITQPESTENDWNKNLSWSGEDSKKVYVGNYAKDADHEQITASANLASNSSRIYTTLPKDDTNLVILVKKMENFPKPEDISRKREYYNTNVKKLEQAKKALVALMHGMHDSNASLTLAYTTIDSDLRHAIVEERSFEAKLKMEAQSIEDLIDLFKSSSDYSKVLHLAKMYGFEVKQDISTSSSSSTAEKRKPKSLSTESAEILKQDFTDNINVKVKKKPLVAH